MPSNVSRPLPDDFKVVAATMSQMRLAAHYQAGGSTIQRWLRESGLPLKGRVKSGTPKGQSTGKFRARPDDFEARYIELGPTALPKYFKAGKQVVKRWTREVGKTRLDALRAAFLRKAREVSRAEAAQASRQRRAQRRTAHTRNVRHLHRNGNASAGNPTARMPELAGGIAAAAADHLRRVAKIENVYHRIILGKQHKGTYYVHGKGVMGEAAMIAFARSRGFQSIFDRVAA